MQSSNGQSRDERLLSPPGSQARFTAERVLRTRPKTYRAIVQLLADPHAKIEHIAKLHRVSPHTVRAIRERESVAIAERKQRLVSIFGNVAEIAAERMEELAGKASLRDAGTTAGIATDKLLALTGEPSLNIQVNHSHTHDLERIIHCIRTFNLDPEVIIQDMQQHQYTNSPLQNAGIAVLNAMNAKAEKRAKARGVELPALPPRRDASIAEKNGG